MSKHPGNTGEVTEVKLTSAIEQVAWTRRVAAPGAKVGLEVSTRFVGNHAPLKVRLTDGAGKTVGSYDEHIAGNVFGVELVVPAGAKKALVAEVSLPKHGLSKTSDALLLLDVVEVENAKWSQKEARRGDVLTLTADVAGAPDGTEAEVSIWEHDADGAHDLVTRFPVLVKQGKVSTEWVFEYQEDTDDIPRDEELEPGYAHPEYFFRVALHGVSADSELLRFKDWLEIELRDWQDQPVPNERYTVRLADGTEREGQLDGEGRAHLEDVPPGPWHIDFAGDREA